MDDFRNCLNRLLSLTDDCPSRACFYDPEGDRASLSELLLQHVGWSDVNSNPESLHDLDRSAKYEARIGHQRDSYHCRALGARIACSSDRRRHLLEIPENLCTQRYHIIRHIIHGQQRAPSYVPFLEYSARVNWTHRTVNSIIAISASLGQARNEQTNLPYRTVLQQMRATSFRIERVRGWVSTSMVLFELTPTVRIIIKCQSFWNLFWHVDCSETFIPIRINKKYLLSVLTAEKPLPLGYTIQQRWDTED